MKAIVVYESLWGNTAAIARAIAEGLGADVPALCTDEATTERLEGVDLIIAGAPVIAFSLPSEQVRKDIPRAHSKAPTPPDLSHSPMRDWLKRLPQGSGRAVAFETRIWWSPGGSTSAILRGLQAAGYQPVGKGQRFIVTGTYGPLKEGELERARQWGRELAKMME